MGSASRLRRWAPARGGGPIPTPQAPAPVLETRGLTVTAGARTLLRRVELAVPPRQVTGLIGPSGAGKTTLLRCLNRLVELSPGLAVSGQVLFEGRPIYHRGVDPDHLRARIGILFQQPVVFPGSIYRNVIFGLSRVPDATGRWLPRRRWRERAEAALREAALWQEVAHRLEEPAASLSVGQQQRLCLARALALEPPVLLMDEPTSALDPRATEAIEALVSRLKARHTLVLVTHDLAQARRLCDRVACLCVKEGAGELLECAAGDALFNRPRCREVAEYLDGRPAEGA